MSNAPVVVNSDHVLYIAGAVDANTRSPLLGYSAVFFNHSIAGQGQPHGILVKGNPEEVKAQIESQENYTDLQRSMAMSQ